MLATLDQMLYDLAAARHEFQQAYDDSFFDGHDYERTEAAFNEYRRLENELELAYPPHGCEEPVREEWEDDIPF